MIKHEVTQENGSGQAEERALLYMLLTRLFADQSTIADLENYIEALKMLTEEPSGLASILAQRLKDWQEVENNDHLLKTEYARLFIMPGGIRPYESVYRGEKALLMQEPWLEVKRFYKHCGLKLENPTLHPEDHVSTEFAFMLYLLEQGNRDVEEKAFFTGHLDCWVPRMLEELAAHQHACFYREVAQFGLLFLKSERAIIGLNDREALATPDQTQGSER